MMQSSGHSFLPDPVLSEKGDEIGARLLDYADQVAPEDLPALMDALLRDLFEGAMERVGADSGTIWLADKERTKLVVGYAHPIRELMGKEQPLDEGLISLVLASEQGICEHDVYRNEQHSKRIDEALGKVTCAMIAVPIYLGGALRGVISAVQWKKDSDAPDPPGFTAKDLHRAQRLSKMLERALNYKLLKIILDLNA
ncbi:MAG: GAF domain-containing protein [Verrucomicrobiales bacterium]